VNQKKYQDERKLKSEIFLKTEAEKKGKEKKQLDELKGYYGGWSTQRDFTDQDLQKRVDHLELYLLRAKEIGLKKLVRKSCQKGVSQEILNELWKGATELRKLIKNPTQYSPQLVQCFLLSILKSFDQNLQDLAQKRVEKKEKKMFVAPMEIYVETFEFIEPIVHIKLKKSDDETVVEIPDSKEDLGVEDPQSPEVKKRKYLEEQKKEEKGQESCLVKED